MKTDYWQTRDAILKDLSENDDKKLRDLAASHPKIFQQLVNQAKKSKWHITKPPKEKYES